MNKRIFNLLFNPHTHMEYTPQDITLHTEIRAKLFSALALAIAECKDVHADSTNPFHKNKYASLGAHLEVVKPIFAKHGLAVVQFPSGFDKCIGVTTKIIHKDGGHIEEACHIPVGDNATGQQAGAIISYLRRYALASIAGIATDDDDAETDRIARAPSAPAFSAGSKFIPTNNKVSDYTVVKNGGEVDFELAVPFGDAKGTKLSELPLKNTDRTKKCADLSYWASVWQPKPFGTSTTVSKRDLNFKASAQALWAIKNSQDEAPTESTDEIPF